MGNIKGLFYGLIVLIFMTACCQKSIDVVEIKHFPVDNMEGIIGGSGVFIDKEISSDGNGSLCITAIEPATVRLYETGDIDIENAKLICQAKLRTEVVEGQVYMEMLCHFPGRGEFFSRTLQFALTGSNEWTSHEVPFFLKKGENPDNVKINIIIEGKGKVWIDDIRLIKAKLN